MNEKLELLQELRENNLISFDTYVEYLAKIKSEKPILTYEELTTDLNIKNTIKHIQLESIKMEK